MPNKHLPSDLKRLRLKLSFIFSVLYVSLSSLYIYFSDIFVLTIATTPQELALFQTIKGVSFMVICGIALFALLYTSMGRLLRANTMIQMQKESVIMSEQRALSGLLASAALHEINNLIMIINMHLEIIESDTELQPESQKSMEKVRRVLQNMHNSLKRPLLFSKESIDKGTSTYAEVLPYITQSWEMLEHIHRGKKIAFKCHAEFPEIKARIHASLLKQALMNIMLHSVRAIPAEGTIEVILRSGQNETLIEIHDSSPELNTNWQEETIYSSDQNLEDANLALMASRLCIEAQNGKVEVSSSHLHGTCYRLRLDNTI